MDCKPISVNTSFKVKPHSKNNPLKLYYARRKVIENKRREIIEKSGSHDYSNGFSGILEGFMSLIDGFANIFKSFGPEPNYPKIKKYGTYSSRLAKQIDAEAMKRDVKAMEGDLAAIGGYFGTVGDYIRNAMRKFDEEIKQTKK